MIGKYIYMYVCRRKREIRTMPFMWTIDEIYQMKNFTIFMKVSVLSLLRKLCIYITYTCMYKVFNSQS